MLSSIYGEAALSEIMCREWFQRFKGGDFNVEDRHGGGKEIEDSELVALLAENSCRKLWLMPGHSYTSAARPNVHGAKVMLCIWWDQLGVVYYELLKPSETITGDRYRTRLMCFSRALKEKRP